MSGTTGTMSPRRIALDVAVQLAGQGLNLFLGVFVTLLVVRSLGSRYFGEWSTILAVLQIVGLFASLNLANVTIRNAAADPEHAEEWLGAYVSFTAVLTVPVTAVSLGVLELLASDSQMRVAGLLMSGTMLVGAVSSLGVIFRLRVQNHVTTAVATANSVLWGGAVLAISVLGGGLVALAAAFLVTAALVQCGQAIYAVKSTRFRLRGSQARWSSLARVGLAAGIGSVLAVAYARIDQVLVFELAPHRADAGLYGAIYRILDQASFVPNAAMVTLFPIISAAYPHQPARVRRLVQLAVDNLALISFPVLAFSIVAASPLVHLIFGVQFDRAAGGLPVLMAAYVVICFGYVAGFLGLVLGLQRRFAYFALAGLVLNVAVNLALIPRYGFHGAAWATLATELLVVGIEVLAVVRALHMRVAVRRLVATAGAAALAGVAVWAARSNGFGFGELVALMLVVYPILILSLRAVDLTELRALLPSRKGSL